MPIDFSQMNLTGVDLAYAISQQQLNEAVATTLLEAPPGPLAIDFEFAYSGTNWVAPTPALPVTLTFSGTWAPAIDADSGTLRVPPIDLSQGATLDPSRVVLNMTFAAGATLDNLLRGNSYVQPDPTSAATPLNAIWVVPMAVSLSVSDLESSAIPNTVQNQLNILNGHYGNIFSAQQVLMDLSTLLPLATLAQTSPQGVDAITWTSFQDCLVLYLKSCELAGRVPLAYLIQQGSGAPAATPSTITPTSADLVIVPNAQAPGLSALIFAMMSQNRTLPAALGDSFEGVGFTDPNATGTVVIRQGLLAEVLLDSIANARIPDALSFYIDARPQSPSLTCFSDSSIPAIQPEPPTSDNDYLIGSFTYSRSTLQISFSVMVRTTMSVSLVPSATSETTSTLNLNGSVMGAMPGGLASTLLGPRPPIGPPLQLPWNAQFSLQADNTTLVVIDINFEHTNLGQIGPGNPSGVGLPSSPTVYHDVCGHDGSYEPVSRY